MIVITLMSVSVSHQHVNFKCDNEQKLMENNDKTSRQEVLKTL